MERKFYINGEERSMKAFYSFDLDNPNIHFVIVEKQSNKWNKTIEWGNIPQLIIKKK